MQRIESSFMQDLGGSIRKYFNFEDIRMMLVEHYADMENWHKHETTSQIIFVIEGSIVALTISTDSKSGCKGGIVLHENEFIQIPAGEWHKISPNTPTTKLLVMKYKASGTNIIDQLKKDYIHMEI